MLHSAWAIKCFPLTLTLSLGEREQQASDSCLADGRWANSGTGVIVRPFMDDSFMPDCFALLAAFCQIRKSV